MAGFKSLLVVTLVILVSSLTPCSEGYGAPSPATSPENYLVAVDGSVYCKLCKTAKPYPLPGAVVKLHCNVTSGTYVQNATTESDGSFLILASPEVSIFDVRRCKVYLVSSPVATCSKARNVDGGVIGSPLKKKEKEIDNTVYFTIKGGNLEYESPTESCP